MTDVSSVSQIRSEIVDSIIGLVHLEQQNSKDIRGYTTLNLLESLDIVRDVILSRLSDCIDEWKGDENKQYAWLFGSIESQAALAVENNNKVLVNNSWKNLRFVHPFNTVVLPRLINLLKSIGPTGAQSLVEPIVDDIKNQMLNVEETSTEDITTASHTLNRLKPAQQQRKAMSKERRLDLIAAMFERIQEAR